MISAEAVGQEGLQLFVDAGVPLDDRLVSYLIKEVLMEKAGGMFAQTEGASEAPTAVKPSPPPKPTSPSHRPKSPSKVITPRAPSPKVGGQLKPFAVNN